MTAQRTDTFIFKDNKYSLIGIAGSSLASPRQFGMIPEMLSTGCYRGFFATYELTDEALLLRDMTLREMFSNYLPINGVEPEKEQYQATYRNLSVKIPFTGIIRLAKDFISELSINMGFQKPTAFKTVLDFTIEDGKIIDIKDRSADMEKKRGAFKKYYTNGDLMETIEDAFSLDLDLE
jgi:hypothetical protein